MLVLFVIWVSLSVCRTGSGTFKDGDLLVNRDGVRIVSHSEVEAVSGFLFFDFSDVLFSGFFIAFLNMNFC